MKRIADAERKAAQPKKVVIRTETGEELELTGENDLPEMYDATRRGESE